MGDTNIAAAACPATVVDTSMTRASRGIRSSEFRSYGFLRSLALAATLGLAAASAHAACPTFHTLANGTTADANQVMDNFNYILSCPNFTGNVGIATPNPKELLHLNDMGAGGSNIKQFAYAYLGSDYSGWTTILGSNVRAKHGTTSGMELGSSFTNDGASAIDLKFATIEFHTASASAISGYTEGSPFSFVRMVIDGQGNVGIGTSSPASKLDVAGTVNASGGYTQNSDARLKTDITPFASGALDIVMRLKPVTFRWKKPSDASMQGEQLGFIAQDVEKILPAVVTTRNDAMKTKAMNYSELIPVLTKALQELEIHQRKQDALIATLIDRNRKLHAALRMRSGARLASD